MAKRHLIQLIDDLDGSTIDGNGKTVKFGLDGRSYEIDLSDKNADLLREVLAPYLKAARSLPANPGRRADARSNPSDHAAIRGWANANGYDVGDRARIPAAVREAYATR